MKCVENDNGRIVRVSDEEARRMVQYFGWVYCSKSAYKAQQAGEQS